MTVFIQKIFWIKPSNFLNKTFKFSELNRQIEKQAPLKYNLPRYTILFVLSEVYSPWELPSTISLLSISMYASCLSLKVDQISHFNDI